MLEQVEQKLKQIVKSLGSKSVEELYSKVPSGKRLRSKLILKIAGGSDEAVMLCSIVELIHAASLLHDDVIDDALTRRGVESVNALYGDKTAIMLGDILYSKAFFELTSFDPNIAKAISNAVTLLSIGELQDVQMGEKFNPQVELYDEMIYNKTASLIEASAIGAALLCGKDEKAFGLYGKNLGLAFQIVDDVLDITQDSATLGKPSLNDFVEGKTTLPYIYMYERINQEDKQRLLKSFGKKTDKDESDWIKAKLYECGAISDSIKEAQRLGYEALESIKNSGVEGLERIVLQMIEREF